MMTDIMTTILTTRERWEKWKRDGTGLVIIGQTRLAQRGGGGEGAALQACYSLEKGEQRSKVTGAVVPVQVVVATINQYAGMFQ